ncbi:MAG TPA: recombinase family protein [Candidatus Angelobacter sp.]|jgi:DNA invertase Pin-like site-specific DNA recombinase|nr:recombinase family protein [Candidatus Angelobacter sp.]
MEGRSDRRHRRPGERRPAARRPLVHKSSVSCTQQQGEARRRTVGTRRGARRSRAGAPLAGYIRVSTTEQGEDGAGLEAQLAELAQACAGRGLLLGRVYRDVASGGSLDGRRDLRRALAAIRRGDASGIVVPRLDRLSRSVHDFSGLLRRSRREGWQLVLADLGLDLTTPTGELIATILAALAEFERRLIGLNTKRALAVKRAQGVRLGRPPAVPNEVRRRIHAERAVDTSWRAIADGLNRDGVPTSHGGVRWHASTVRSVAVPRASRHELPA